MGKVKTTPSQVFNLQTKVNAKTKNMTLVRNAGQQIIVTTKWVNQKSFAIKSSKESTPSKTFQI